VSVELLADIAYFNSRTYQTIIRFYSRCNSAIKGYAAVSASTARKAPQEPFGTHQHLSQTKVTGK
jgi:hypothetical protein